MQTKLDIFTQHYFPFHFIALGVAFLLISVLTSMMNPIVSIILFILGVIFITTHYRVMLDVKNKKYKEYLWILGFKNGPTLPFQEIEDIYVNQIDREGEFGLVARVNTKKTVYMGFLKLSDDEPVFIGEHRIENKALNKVKKVADLVKIDIRKNY